MGIYFPQKQQACPVAQQPRGGSLGNRITGPAPTEKWQVLVVDACSYGRSGLVMALQQQASHVLDGPVMEADTLALSALPCSARGNVAAPLRCLVLRLPPAPQIALSLLLQLGEFSAMRLTRIVVITSQAADAVRHVLVSAGLLCAVSIVGSHLSPVALCRAILPEIDGRHDKVGVFGEFLPYCPGRILTRRERRALVQTMREIPVYTQARNAFVCTKTIYTQRSCALLKLGVQDFLTLVRHFTPAGRPDVSIFQREGKET